MKLQNKINIRFMVVTFVVFVIAGVMFYFALDWVIDHNINGILKSRKAYVILYLQNHGSENVPKFSPDHSIFIRQVNKNEKHLVYSDTLAFDEKKKELIPFRKMVFTTAVQNNIFEVTLLQSMLESEDLQAIIIYFMVFLFILILLTLFFLNRWLSNKDWKPFFRSSALLKSWEIGKSDLVHFDRTGISEFDQLNKTLQEMIEKMQADFVNLREFTENAAHEIQTPLAIIKSKLEMLLNDPALTSKQHVQLHEVFETTIRLSKMNETLLLLSKIENRQFVEKSEIDFSSLVASRLTYLEELIDLKQIKLSLDLSTPFIVSIHPMLADILLNNLLSNAIKHNYSHGEINIKSGNNEIIFSNTGALLTIDPLKIFKRFVKQSTSEASNGLGLAIADEICKSNQLSLDYAYQNQLHCFKLGKKAG